MDLSKLRWIKNVKHKGDDKLWAYDKLSEMPIPEAKIFRLAWRDSSNKGNAKKPKKGDLMLLLQKAKVTHLVEFLDDELYKSDSDEWCIYRVVKALWMPPEDFDWDKLRHQRDFFGSDYIVGDGAAHDLAAENQMLQFHQYWDVRGGLVAFQNHVGNLIHEMSSTTEAEG
ncbi:hypothetical protein [Pantanalinema rosaneae]|uniref:hypothetical protein n=1 Tax=Pantanalinema rosaneae TaxID=1620701 RepID=UPI003D6DECCE